MCFWRKFLMIFWIVVLWVGKFFFCIFYVMSNLNHFTHLNDIINYNRSRQLPLPQLLVPISGTMLITGSLMFLLRWHQIWGLALLTFFLITTTVFIHKY